MGEELFDTWLYDRLRGLNTDENVFGPYIKSILEESEEDLDEKIEGLDGLLVELQGNFDAVKVRDEILERWDAAQSKSATPSSCSNANNSTSNILNGASDGKSVDGITSTLEKVTTSCVTSGSGQQQELLLKSETNKNTGSHNLDNHVENLFRLSGLDNNESQQSSASEKTNDRLKGDLGADSALRAAILSQYRGYDSSSDDEDGPPGKSKTKSDASNGLERNDNAEKVMAEQRELKEKSRLEHTKKKERDKEDRAKQKQAAEERKEKAKKKAQKTERKR